MSKFEGYIHRYRPAAAFLVHGEDSFSFLQGQFTQDLRGEPGSAKYGLWLSEKGKVVADSMILRVSKSEFRILSLGSLAALLSARFEKYIVADEVSFDDETEKTFALLAWGRDVVEWTEKFVGQALPVGGFVEHEGLRIFRAQRLGGAGVEITASDGIIASLSAELLRRGATAADQVLVERCRLEAGVPAIPLELGPADLPNEGGLEESAISFHKGCYLGQEVMARLKNLGRVRRVLRRVRGVGLLPDRGAILYQNQVKVGEIRSVIPTSEGFVGMAMVLRSGVDDAAGFTVAVEGSFPPPSVWTS